MDDVKLGSPMVNFSHAQQSDGAVESRTPVVRLVSKYLDDKAYKYEPDSVGCQMTTSPSDGESQRTKRKMLSVRMR